jgi:hypothetical protein
VFSYPDLDLALALIADPDSDPYRIRLAHEKYIRLYLICPEGSTNSPLNFELKII